MTDTGFDKEERFFRYWLHTVPDMTAGLMKKLLEKYGSARDVFMDSGRDSLLNEKNREAFEAGKADAKRILAEYEGLGARGIKFILAEDDGFPRRLREIPDSPCGLFVKGELPDDDAKSVAIVGARRATMHGKWFAKSLASDLVTHGIPIISGMAEGIDGSGHEGALSAGGRTVAVLGTGIDICYPMLHEKLYNMIPEHGAVISEYGPAAPGVSYHFPARNRIISGLSDIVIVVEAKERSGSLITVVAALKQGRDVMAVPGRPDDPCSRACNRLLKEGAACCTCAEDVLRLLELTPQKPIAPAERDRPSGNEALVLASIYGEPRHTDDIAKATGLSPQEVANILISLEIKGKVSPITTGLYIRK